MLAKLTGIEATYLGHRSVTLRASSLSIRGLLRAEGEAIGKGRSRPESLRDAGWGIAAREDREPGALQ